MKNLPAAVAAALAPCLAAAFSFDDIHFWVGEGTNRTVVVVDWNVPGEASSLAWGYRWNGDDPPMARVVADVAREDGRLHYFSSQSQWGTSVDGFGYDRADVAASFDLASETATDASALFAAYAGPYYWAQSPGTGTDFASVAWTIGSGVDADHATDGGWYCFKRTNWETWESSEPVAEPAPAESPYGWRVVAADVAGYVGWDGVASDPGVALGAPARTVSGYQDIPVHPATPGESAWETDRIVKLATATGEDAGGSITVEFDHPVADDPRNPFGLDFIVFSYRFITVQGGYYSTTDPGSASVRTDSMYAPAARVEASADGETWFDAGTGLSRERAFAPTLGYRYDPENPDRSLFGDYAVTNEWWGAPADATRPVDPSFSLEDCAGLSLAEICRRYDGSAGGTGFDIGGLDLPRDALGRKFIRFLRITSLKPGGEISLDAVADVAPAPSFRNWVDAHVAFEDRPGFAKDAVCANGEPAFVNAALGLAPDAPAPAAWAIEGFDPATRTLAAPLAPFAADLVRIRSSASLTNANWSASLPVFVGTNALGRPLLRAQDPATAAAPAAFFRLELHE